MKAPPREIPKAKPAIGRRCGDALGDVTMQNEKPRRHGLQRYLNFPVGRPRGKNAPIVELRLHCGNRRTKSDSSTIRMLGTGRQAVDRKARVIESVGSNSEKQDLRLETSIS